MEEPQVNNQTDNTNNEIMAPLEAEVIGELRKDKIGRPILVLEMAILFAIVLIALPIVSKMMNNENSFLYKLINGSKINTPVITPSTNQEFLNGGELQTLSSTTKIKYENIIMEDFTLASNQVKCKIYSYNGSLNLDEKEYYLEIYSSSNNKLGAVKLTGIYDNVEKEVELLSKNINFNNSFTYSGKIVLMGEDDYPDVTLSSDESGLASLVCKNDVRTIEYTFKNKYLINIKDQSKYNNADYSSQDYINLKGELEKKANTLGSNLASVEEISDGLLYKANIDLEKNKLPNGLDYNYYPLDANANMINYSMSGKGFDCK